ncbi:MAG: ABC transporter permease [Candidatus Eremiobacteraeota bacterium]|nr:ABC transporter permease [Candidatus Eremiobacteraeota bacterium]MBC5827789.1 ABC transporter permease [Candidatus Eremiobacteraeota bacterium]
MKLGGFFASAVDTLWANRMRSLLTMIGIVIGTAAVIAILGIGQSASSSIGATLGSFGNQGVIIMPEQGSRRVGQAQIQWSDVQVLRDDCSPCGHVLPFYDSYYFIRHGHTKDAFELASDSDYVVDTLAMAEGRRFNSDDVNGARPVCDLLSGAKQKLFGDAPALGKYVRIAGRRFLVVGVFAPASAGIVGAVGGGSDSINIPYTTYHKLPDTVILGIQVYPAAGATAAEVTDETQAILRRLHGTRVKYQSIDITQQETVFLNVIKYVSIGVSAIGAIALVVGGIGVMNIMLVSVIERTREIGIRKAIGASRGDILLQFLIEAVTIALIGGVVGGLVGAGAAVAASAVLVKQLAGSVAAIHWLSIVTIALGTSLAIGIFFGTYPALRAARLSPIECLRHE